MAILKKCVIFAAFLVLSMYAAATAYAADTEYKLVVNGKELVFENGTGPINRNGSVYVPLRDVFDALNDGTGSMNWDGENNRETLTLRGINMNLLIGDPMVEINGEAIAIPGGGAPLLYNDAVYIPVRFFADQLGMAVGWNKLYSTVSIIDKAEYDTICDLFSSQPADIRRLSMDMAMNIKAVTTSLTPYSMHDSDINPDADVLYYNTMTEDMSLNGSLEFDQDNEFAYVNMDLTSKGQTMAAEAYLLSNIMYIKTNDTDQWLVQPLNESPFDLGAEAFFSQNALPGYANMMPVGDPYDALMAFGLSTDDNGDLSVSGNIMITSELNALITGGEPEEGAAPVIPPIPVRFVFDRDTMALKAINMDLTVSNSTDMSSSYTVTVNLNIENINLSPGFEPVVPDEVVNSAVDMNTYVQSSSESY